MALQKLFTKILIYTLLTQYNQVYTEAAMKEKVQYWGRTCMDKQDLPAQDTQFNNRFQDKMFILKKIQQKYQILQRPNLKNLLCEKHKNI